MHSQIQILLFVEGKYDSMHLLFMTTANEKVSTQAHL